jgi:hypothetical protein
MRHLIALSLLLIAAPAARAAQTAAYALTSDFVTGSLSVADLATRGITKDVATVNSDAVARSYGGLVYVVNRYGADNIQVVDPARNFQTVRQFSVGNGSNPQDIVLVSPTRAYVSRYGSADLLIVDPSSPAGLPMSTISLAGFADADGLPEMARMLWVEPYLLIACQRLTNFSPSNQSVIAVVDTRADSLFDTDPFTPGTQGIALEARNPVTGFAENPVSGRLLIGCAGAYGALDGGIETIDPAALTDGGIVVSEQTLGGDVSDIEWTSLTRVHAIVGDGSSNRLISVGSAGVLDTLYVASGGFSLPDMETNDRGELWVCKNPFPASAADPAGLLVFDAAADTLIAGPLDTGLAPIAVTFGSVAGPAPVPGGIAIDGAAPNPAHLQARISLRLGLAAAAEARIFDLSGRRVRSMDLGLRAAGPSAAVWDLKDDDGRAVPAGLYLVRVRAGGLSASARVVIVR